MLARSGGKKKEKAKTKAELQQENEARAVATIQCAIRCFVAKCRATHQTKKAWHRVFDPTYKKYFWYQKFTGESKWKIPKRARLFNNVDVAAIVKIAKVVRGFNGRCKAKRKAATMYSRFFDPKVNRFYWYDKATEKSTYQASSWLTKQNIPLPPEDQLIYDAFQKIKALEAELKKKDKEIKDVRKKRFEELEPQVILDKVTEAKNLKRSKDMDTWSINDLAAFFTELKMDQYINFLYQNRVDGLLFINLTDDDWADMGVTNRFHVRKLQLVLKGYRLRYKKKKAKINDEDDDDDEGSEYTPSELSDIIANENADNDYESEGEESEMSDKSHDTEEEDMARLEEEAALQAQLDEQNIVIQMLAAGDNENRPILGDIVRVKYTVFINDSNGKEKVIMSTKTTLQRPWIELVLGVDQVVIGVDRALPQMSIGERSKLILSPEYAYGAEGLPPHIPPNSTIMLDITLLGFRPRSQWVKPLIQDATTKEKPYHEEWLNYLRATNTGDQSRFKMEDEEEEELANKKKGGDKKFIDDRGRQGGGSGSFGGSISKSGANKQSGRSSSVVK